MSRTVAGSLDPRRTAVVKITHPSPSCEDCADAGQSRLFVNPHYYPLRRQVDAQEAAFFASRNMRKKPEDGECSNQKHDDGSESGVQHRRESEVEGCGDGSGGDRDVQWQRRLHCGEDIYEKVVQGNTSVSSARI